MQAQDPRTPWMNAADESGLVLKARKGDRKAFVDLLRHYHRAVYRLAFALTRDVHAAVAVTHGTLVKAREGVRYIADGQRFFPWIAGIVRSLARARRRDAEATLKGNASVAPGVAELAQRLMRTMDGLDPDAQAALALRIVELLPNREIEAVLRTQPGSARGLLAEARSRLSAQLKAAA
jgi:RNA polymerase sigma-70 factor, ECF subfamily